MPGQIAQLIVPSDGLGNPAAWDIDYARGAIFLHQQNSVRRYSLTMATQNPAVSAGWNFPGSGIDNFAIDPVTGHIYRCNYGGNAALYEEHDGTTLALISTYGGFTGFPSYPSLPAAAMVMQGIGVQTLGGGQQGYIVSQCFGVDYGIDVFFANPFAPAGFTGHRPADANQFPCICAGPSGGTSASVFISYAGGSGPISSGGLPSREITKVTITRGAETYNISSWPTTNSHITAAPIGSIAASAIDPMQNTMGIYDLGYDHSDNTLLVYASCWITTGSTTSNNKSYLLKVSATDAHIIWNIPFDVAKNVLSCSNVTAGSLVLLPTSTWRIIDTPTGDNTDYLLTGLTPNTGSFGVRAYMSSDDATSIALMAGSFAQDAHSPIPVSGTPSSFSGWALIQFGPPRETLIDSELFFSPTAGFVDFAAPENRRLFIAASGTPQWMERNGSIPLGAVPPVYLTTLGPPIDFAQNNGAGGAFALTGGTIGAVGGPGCTPYFIPEAAGPAADPQWRLSYSDDGARTWSRLVKPRTIGQTGHYLQRLRWLKMGQSRERVIKLECTDPDRRNIVGIYIDAGPGLD